MTTRIVLYICGIALILAAVIIILKGVGILPTVPGYVIWAMVLITIGIGILGGISAKS